MAAQVIIPAAIQGLSLLYDTLKGAKSDKEAKAALDRIKEYYDNIDLPDIEKQKVALQAIEYAGDVVPPEIRRTAFQDIGEDPRLRSAQMDALSKLSEIGQEGLTDTDRARMEEIAMQESTRERGAREAIQQRARQMGTAGSGLSLAQQMIGQQESAGRRALGGFQTARAAEQRALQGIMGAGQLGGQIRGQEYGMQADRARAMDALRRFNAANLMQSRMRNVGARQALSAANTDIRNRQQMYNKGLQQQQFQNQLALGKAKTTPDMLQYGYYQPQSEKYGQRAYEGMTGLYDWLKTQPWKQG